MLTIKAKLTNAYQFWQQYTQYSINVYIKYILSMPYYEGLNVLL